VVCPFIAGLDLERQSPKKLCRLNHKRVDAKFRVQIPRGISETARGVCEVFSMLDPHHDIDGDRQVELYRGVVSWSCIVPPRMVTGCMRCSASTSPRDRFESGRQQRRDDAIRSLPDAAPPPPPRALCSRAAWKKTLPPKPRTVTRRARCHGPARLQERALARLSRPPDPTRRPHPRSSSGMMPFAFTARPSRVRLEVATRIFFSSEEEDAMSPFSVTRPRARTAKRVDRRRLGQRACPRRG